MDERRPRPAQLALCEELRRDLERQLGGDVALPAMIAVDAEGNVLRKALMPLDTGGQPISDAVMGDTLRRYLKSEGLAPAAIGWVRVDI